MAKKSKPAKPPSTVSEKIDQELAASCLRKRRAGEKPSREEIRALQRIETAREEADRWRHYETVPKKHYLEMAGDCDRPRAAKVVLEQADRYGAPLYGRTVNLRKVFRWLHDFLAENRWKLAESDEEILAGGNSEWAEELRKERTLLLRIERETKEGQRLVRNEVHDSLTRVSSILRGVGEMLERQFGADAHQLLDDALDDAQLEIDRIFQNGQTLKGGDLPSVPPADK